MGAVGRNRLTYSAPFSGMQADLVGPMSIKKYVNQRGPGMAAHNSLPFQPLYQPHGGQVTE